jgi:membrane-associated phospholipid phosphatase
MTYNDIYVKISNPFRRLPFLLLLLRLMYYAIPAATVLIYVYIIINVYINRGALECSRVVLLPLITLILVTVFRKRVNADRPAAGDGIEPLIQTRKLKESFPSRHTASLAIIAMAGLYCDWRLGILLWCMTLLQGLIRIISGAHYPKDIAGGIAVGLLIGLLFFI